MFRPLGPHAPNDRIALEPIGVVGLITPWNWPLNQIALKAIPAILTGCTCVLKPSEESPLDAMMSVTDRLQAAGLTVLRPRTVDCGDAGIALGQAWIAACTVHADRTTED